MLQAMLAGVASIKAQQTRMNVIGDNLANVNTTAYKSSRVTFQDMMAQTIRGAARPSGASGGTNPVQYGLGVLVAGTNVDNTQGSLNATNRTSDLAIQGNGYLMVTNGDTISYTRDGALDLDAAGDLTQSGTGERVVGWTADANGNIDTTVPIDATTSINIPLGTLNAVQKTTKVTMTGNLNGQATSTDSWTAQVKVYDSLGGSHTLTYKFSNHQTSATAASTTGWPSTASSSWDWQAYEGDATTGTPLSNSATAGNESLYFDSNGKMVSNLAAGTYNQVTVPASTASNSTAFSFDTDFTTITQLNTDSQVTVKDQNGYPPGSLASYSIGSDGIITGNFTNGLTRPLAQLALANFSNPNGLERIGNNLWRNTDNSGVPVIGTAKTGGRGSINSGYLEQSNVDISNEFTDLIITQRGFQANTKVVTTVDEMLQDLISMKR